MAHAWFTPWGWIHRPRSAAGWAVTLAAIAYAVHVFIAVDARAHSISDALYAVYPQWGVTFLGWEWLAARTSARQAR